MGWIPFRDAIAYSRNVATAERGDAPRSAPRAASAGSLYRTWQQLRHRPADRASTWPARSAGIARRPARPPPWRPSTSPTAPSGRRSRSRRSSWRSAYAAMVNGGFHVQPHFLGVDRRARPQTVPAAAARHQREDSPASCGRSCTTSRPACRGTPRARSSRATQVGGKTGTAQIWDAQRGRYTSTPSTSASSAIVGDPTRGRGRRCASPRRRPRSRHAATSRWASPPTSSSGASPWTSSPGSTSRRSCRPPVPGMPEPLSAAREVPGARPAPRHGRPTRQRGARAAAGISTTAPRDGQTGGERPARAAHARMAAIVNDGQSHPPPRASPPSRSPPRLTPCRRAGSCARGRAPSVAAPSTRAGSRPATPSSPFPESAPTVTASSPTAVASGRSRPRRA